MGAANIPLRMIDRALVEKIWSTSGTDPTYVAEMRRVCLPPDTAGSAAAGLLAVLPQLFCRLHGGNQQQIVPVVTAWTLLRYAARILDDFEDSPFESSQNLNPCFLNVSTGLIFTAGMALNFLEEFGILPAAAVEIRHCFYGELLKTCGGQHLDLVMSALSVEEWWEVAGAKSGAFLGLICWAGGRVGGAEPTQLALYKQFGHTLGLLDQIRDDLADLWADEAKSSDLLQAHNHGLPLAYALAVLPSEARQQLLTDLRQAGESVAAEQRAQALIIQSGAGVFLSVQSVRLYQQGLTLIARMHLPLEAEVKLTDILEKARLPVKR